MRAKVLEALSIVLDDAMQHNDVKPLFIPSDRRRILEARALLESHYDKEWTIQALSRAVGVNEKRLQSGFQALFGLPVHAQLTQIRMNAAAEMLSKGASVTDTAYAVGFSSPSHFGKAFRSAKGAAPKKWALHHQAV